MATNDLRIRISADSSRLERAMDRASSATEKYRDSLTSLEIELLKIEKQLDDEMAAAAKRNEDALRKQEEAATALGEGMLAVGAAIAAGLGLAAKEAIEWESAWAGVAKTTEGTPEQLAALESELREMAKTLPASHAEIAAVAEAAGQLGVKRKDVAAFTETMIAMSVATNLTADEAATAMARFANIMSTPVSDVDRLGAALVALGNAGASTESEILEMGLRIAGAGRQAGLSEADVLALANALSSVGIEAEAGGSAISTVLIKMTNAVAEGEEAVQSFADIAGLSAREFVAAWQKDPTAALLRFEQGLAQVEQQGGNVFGVLEDLGITEIRQRDAVLRLSGANQVLADSLKTGERAWKQNAALMDEANKRYETTESRIKVARNQLSDFAITLGETLLPVVAGFAQAGTEILDFFSSLPGPVQTGVVILGSLAAVIGVVGGAALVAVPKITAMRVQLATLGGVAGATRTAISATSSLLLGPWGIAIAAATVGLGVLIARHAKSKQEVDAYTDSLDENTGAITDNTRALAAKQLEDDGILQTAEKLGISLKTVTDAALGSSDAMDKLTRIERRYNDEWTAYGSQINRSRLRMIKEIIAGVRGEQSSLDDAIAAQRRKTEASKDDADATADATEWTTKYGEVTADTADEVKELEQAVEELREQLELLNDAVLGSEHASLAWRKTIRGLSEEVDRNKDAIDGWSGTLKAGTKAGDANREMLLDAIEAAKDDAEAVYDVIAAEEGHEAAVRAVNARMRTNINTLLDEAKQLGLNEAETRRYIARILGIPEKAVTKYSAPGLKTALDRARELDGKADALDGRTVRTTFVTQNVRIHEDRVYRTTGKRPGQVASGGLIDLGAPGGVVRGMAPGGIVTGPGTGTSDTAGLFALSAGEFVVNAASTAANLDLLRVINSTRRPIAPTGDGGAAIDNQVDVRVFVGERELTDIVDVRISENNRALRRRVMAGGSTR